MKKSVDPTRAVVAAALAAAVVSVLVFVLVPSGEEEPARGEPLPGAAAGIRFDRSKLPINGRNLFELSVADYDNDGLGDIATANHSQASSLLHNSGDGSFQERIYSSGLHQDPDFPGISDLTRPPDLERAGLYVFGRPGGQYEIRRIGDPGSGSGSAVGGTLRFRSEVRVTEAPDSTGAEFEVERGGGGARKARVVSFELPEPGSGLTVNPPFLDVPVTARIDRSVPLGQIFVGSRAVRPPAREFTMRIPDRHGIAFGDVDGDGESDAWVISGGNKARIDEFRGLIEDELMYASTDSGRRFTDRRAELGVRKETCRGRTAEVVDYDGDGDLDLFESCAEAPPMLYRQRGDGSFDDVSRTLGRDDLLTGTEYRWLDLDGDRRAELLVAREDEFVVLSYDPDSGGLRTQYRVPRLQSERPILRLITDDYDNDGDPDVYGASAAGGVLLVNERGRLRARDPVELGLPKSGSPAAAWVDYDNDGRTDLHLAPQGIFRQGADGTFSPTGLARLPDVSANFAVTSWFDLENDGDRDLVAAFKDGGGDARTVELHESTGGRGHWLDVDLRGAAPNTDAIGAEVRVRAGDKRLTGFVGESDSSRHSRGDYRVYFGLGDRRTVERVVVIWPDGSRTVRRNQRADRVLRIAQPGA